VNPAADERHVFLIRREREREDLIAHLESSNDKTLGFKQG